jgi:pyruvate,water dikinase
MTAPITETSSIEEDAVLLRRGRIGPDTRLFGGKGASLARLITAGHPVPNTGVVTTTAFGVAASDPSVRAVLDRIRSGAEVADEEIDGVFASVQLAPKTVEDIVMTAAIVGRGGPIAVRSSATVEDLGGASFAGQYRSFLDVDSSDPDAVVAAVKHVWASLWFAAPVAYRHAFGLDHGDIRMAVVLMRMIPADEAGVVFTTDPAGSNAARVESVEGLGESLVSGARTPSAWVVPAGQEASLPPAPRTALRLSQQIADEEGAAQDVEWAAVGDDVWIVQARPITVVDSDDGFDSPMDDHLLTTAGIGEMVPGVVPALLWDINRFLIEEAYRSMFDDLDVLARSEAMGKPFVRRVRGRMAIDFDHLRGVASSIPGAVRALEIDYFGSAETDEPLDRSRWGVGSGMQRLGRQIRSARSRQRVIGQADVVTQTVDLLWPRRLVLSALTDAELLGYVARLVDLAARGLASELGVAAAGAAAFGRLESQLCHYLGPETGTVRAQQVVAGIGLERAPEPDASAAIFGGPTWRDLDRGRADRRTDDERFAQHASRTHQERVADLDDELSSLPGWKRTRLLTGQLIDVRRAIVRQQIGDTVAQLRRREETKAAVLQIGGEVRRAHLHLGVRLKQRGVLEQAEDIFLLSSGEVANACAGEAVVGPEVLRRRRRWIDRYEAEGVLPLRFRGVPDRAPAEIPEGNRLQGWGASPGRGSGIGRVVRRPTADFTTGDVLVAETTDASWSPLFLRASAVVVERGGPLSHAAILARELGLPAVLNAAGACQVLDGRRLLVDGSAGIVVIEPDRESLDEQGH